MNSYTIKLENKSEESKVENLARESFWNVYRPRCYEHDVLHILRKSNDFVPELNFVIEKDGEIIGQTVFVKAKIKTDDGRTIPVLTMGPICILPKYQRKGYGKALLDYAIKKAEKYGAGAICFEGNYHFYSKCGFTYASKLGIRYHGVPEEEDSYFFLAKELKDGYLSGITGVYSTPSVYFVDEKDIEIFDKRFPEKEKLKLPTQIF